MNSEKKKILILGGVALQVPFIEKVKKEGFYVITCDNKPDNPGHKIADEYHNVSITDNEAVLQLAKSLQVDAVINYGLEAGVQAAAYAQEKLGKPTSPYESVKILSNKKLFREYLKKNGFCTPAFITCSNKKEAIKQIGSLHFPVVVKPTDLWGSRGVTRVDKPEDIYKALDVAFEKSRGADIIIEEFIEPYGKAIEGNGFAINGKIASIVWADVYSDSETGNPILPVCWCYPSEKPQHTINKLNSSLQRLITLLDMKINAYNVEARIDQQGNVYLMEVAPRNGGTLHDILSFVSGKDAQKAILNAALGEDCSFMTNASCLDYWMGYIVHSNISGIYDGMWFDEKFYNINLREFTPCKEKGELISTYRGTNCAIGPLIARFDTREEMMDVIKDTSRKFFPYVLPR